jgi:hypothetical protein
MYARFSCGLLVMPLREAPSEAAECGTTLLFGEIYTVQGRSETKNGSVWHEIVCEHDQYRGFISDAYHALASSPLAHPHKVTFGFKDKSAPYRYFSPGSLIEESNEFTLPTDPETFLHQYLGTPYLWGGRSLFGIDCSGLSQVFMDFMGHSLPRNASQQYLLGNPIEWGEQQFGDLAFFGAEASGMLPKITHVGIILNSDSILHASGVVRIDGLTQAGIHRKTDGLQTHKLIGIKRFTAI